MFFVFYFLTKRLIILLKKNFLNFFYANHVVIFLKYILRNLLLVKNNCFQEKLFNSLQSQPYFQSKLELNLQNINSATDTILSQIEIKFV